MAWAKQPIGVTGLVMVAMGAAILTGQLTVLSYWLLDAFPILVQ